MAVDPPSTVQEWARWQARFARALGETATQQPVPVGPTPCETVWQAGRARLYRYAPEAPADAPETAPVLIVYSLVNRPFILDLTEERSLVRALRDAGRTVYLLDWGSPVGADRFLTLEDHIDGFLDDAVGHIRDHEEGRAPDLVGVCQGGIFALLYAALHPDRVRRLAVLVTPVDFGTEHDTLAHLARGVDFDQVARAFGNVSAFWLNTVFVSLKPYRLLSERYMDLPELAENPEGLQEFLRMERWMYDSPDQPGAAFAQFARDFYQRNALHRGELKLGDRTVRLEDVQAPVLSIYAERDHLVPPDSARALAEHLPPERFEQHAFAGGHLGVFISRRARREVFPRISTWLNPC